MDSKHARIELIRQRHRKLILEPRKRMEYALMEVAEWDRDPAFDDEDLAAKFAHVNAGSGEDA